MCKQYFLNILYFYFQPLFLLSINIYKGSDLLLQTSALILLDRLLWLQGLFLRIKKIMCLKYFTLYIAEDVYVIKKIDFIKQNS